MQREIKNYPDVIILLNDGNSLNGIPDDSIDFVFSFDLLVHAYTHTLDSCIGQLSKKLNYVLGFIQHSNLCAYKNYFLAINKIPKKIRLQLQKHKLIDHDHFRDLSMSSEIFYKLCDKYELNCFRQEIVNWETKRTIDCFSTFSHRYFRYDKSYKSLYNPNYMSEAKNIKTLTKIY